MSSAISVEHLSKAYRLGQIGTPSESTRPLASLGIPCRAHVLREGEQPAPSRADLEAWWAKTRGTFGQSLAHDRKS